MTTKVTSPRFEKRVDQHWEEITVTDIKKGDRVRMYDGDRLYEVQGVSEFLAVADGTVDGVLVNEIL